MEKAERKIIIEKILKSCLFSEYLPKEFNTDKLTHNIFSIKFISNLAPISFTMEKNDDNRGRRYISIPSVSSFINAVKQLNDADIIDRIIERNDNDIHSFSKIICSDNIREFTRDYDLNDANDINIGSNEDDFIKNTTIKLERSMGCKCLLRLDISNFFGSFYTHNITAIFDGHEWATFNYESQTKELMYNKLASFDTSIRNMNSKRTHGLLVGPRLSFIVAESLLTRIDYELEKALEEKNIDFIRYMDDYDFFVNKEEDISFIENAINSILNNYGFILNDSKKKIESFPFYSYRNYSEIEFHGRKLIDVYGEFGQIEKESTQKGAIFYFCQNIIPLYNKEKSALSLALSILKNYSKSLKSACDNIMKIGLNNEQKGEIVAELINIYYSFLKNKLDLECIWVLYSILKIDSKIRIKVKDIEEMNEISQIIYMYESEAPNIKTLKKIAPKRGWLLNYELFYNDYITFDEFKNNLKENDLSDFNELKERKINFYIKKEIVI